MMSFYRQKIFAPLMSKRLGNEKVKRLRREVLSTACGKILEIGFGSGLNLDCYPATVRSITAIDITPFVTQQDVPTIQVDHRIMSAEKLTFPDSSFDTVVSTFTLCSIPDVNAALNEICRVLRPQGKYIFLEHGKSPDRCIAALQNLLNPFYHLLADGCNVNRDMLQLISAGSLSIKTSRIDQCGLPFSGLYFSGVALKTGVPC